MKKQKKLHLKIPESLSKIIFRGSSEWLQQKYFSKQKHVQYGNNEELEWFQ